MTHTPEDPSAASEQAQEAPAQQEPEQANHAEQAPSQSAGSDAAPQAPSEDQSAVAPQAAEAAGQQEAPADPAEESSELPAFPVLFQAPDMEELKAAALAKKKAEKEAAEAAELVEDGDVLSRKRRRRRRGDSDMELVNEGDDENTVTKVRTPRLTEGHDSDKVASVKGSTRLEAKRQRRRDSRQSGRRRHGITEAEFLARRESVDRQMMVRQKDDRIQIGVLEDGVLAEHFVSETQQDSLIGNVYLGKVQNVLPSMEAAFVDIGRGRNAVLYAGEVNWDASGLDGRPRRIENALKSGDSVLVQVTKDPIGHKGARLTSQISLPGRFLVYVPGGSMTGISRKLPDNERARLKKILKDNLPDGAGVIVRTAAEGAAEEELAHDINRLRAQWEDIQSKSTARKTLAPELLHQEPDLTIKTVRDVFNEDFTSMVVQGEKAWDNIEAYVTYVAPDLVERLHQWAEEEDLFDHYRIEEQLAKALDRKVFLPSGGSLVIDRTEAMTVVDVNTGKFTGSGGNLEETVTKNNLEAAEEIVRQLRLRDIGGIIVIDFIDMVLESNRDLVLRRLVECLGRDRTKHQVAEVTSLGLVQMTRKRMGTGLLDVFSEPCEACAGRGVIVHDQPLKGLGGSEPEQAPRNKRRSRDRDRGRAQHQRGDSETEGQKLSTARAAFANIAAATVHQEEQDSADSGSEARSDERAETMEAVAESKSAKKRKRRKRNRARQEGQGSLSGEAQAAVPEQDSGQVVTLQGQEVSLPQAQQAAGGNEQPASEQGEQGAFSLDTLNAAFDQKARPEQAAGTEQPARPEQGSGTQGSGTRSRRDRNQQSSAREGSEEQNAPAPDSRAAQAERGTGQAQRGSRTARGSQAPRGSQAARGSQARGAESEGASEGRGTGREAADAARRAALQAVEDMRPGRGRRNGGSNGQRSGGSAGRSAEGRGSRRGTSSGSQDIRSKAIASGFAQPVQEGVQLSGVARPGTVSGPETAPEPSSSAGRTAGAAEPQPAAPAAPSRPRRSRRASSQGQGSQITAEEVSAQQGQGSSVVSRAAAPKASGESGEEPTMLGVGVSAREIHQVGRES